MLVSFCYDKYNLDLPVLEFCAFLKPRGLHFNVAHQE